MSAADKDTTPASVDSGSEHDWLEDVTGEKPLDWVRERNADTLSRLGNPEDSPVYNRVLSILNSKDKIPYVHRRDDWFYNFWKDDTHKQGIWRRTTLESYQKDEPDWEIMLDLDQLSKEEGETWVWKGSTWLFEGVGIEQDLCMIKLSKGGADATVLREYDVKNRRFFEPSKDVFFVPEAKTHVSYKTRDILLVSSDFGEGSLTTSGYARTVRQWTRGTALADAPEVFAGKTEDVIVTGSVNKRRGFDYEWYSRAITFWTAEEFVRQGIDDSQPLQKLDVQEDAKASVFGSFLLVELRTAWEVDGVTYKMGSFLSFDLKQFMAGDRSSVQVLFAPGADGRAALSSHTTTFNFLVLTVLDNVCTKLVIFQRQDGTEAAPPSWKKVDLSLVDTEGQPLKGGSSVDAQLDMWAEDEDKTDFIWLVSSGFLEPTTLFRAEITPDAVVCTKMKSLKGVYDTTGLAVSQGEATSADGTKVPYFLVAPESVELNGKQPTLLYGYGGFEISMLPFYASKFGAGWLERGGLFVLANIRGGGEFGPSWHQQALKANRHKAYEDFEAVATDVVKRGLCSPQTLGCMGGSNGGLLTGNMLVRSPEKFGAIVCQVPLLDMKRFSHLLAGASWMGEYGDPDKPEEWEFIKGFSPYHNVVPASKTPYPKILFTTSTRDDRVHPAHARKMVKRLHENGHGDTTFYYENIEGGHGGAANNTQSAFMSTLAYNFLWQHLSSSAAAEKQ